jgi:hypothetical protein
LVPSGREPHYDVTVEVVDFCHIGSVQVVASKWKSSSTALLARPTLRWRIRITKTSLIEGGIVLQIDIDADLNMVDQVAAREARARGELVVAAR